MTDPVIVEVLVDRPYPVIIGTGLLGELGTRSTVGTRWRYCTSRC